MLSIKSLCSTTDSFDVCLILDALQTRLENCSFWIFECATLTCETEDEIDILL